MASQQINSFIPTSDNVDEQSINSGIDSNNIVDNPTTTTINTINDSNLEFGQLTESQIQNPYFSQTPQTTNITPALTTNPLLSYNTITFPTPLPQSHLQPQPQGQDVAVLARQVYLRVDDRVVPSPVITSSFQLPTTTGPTRRTYPNAPFAEGDDDYDDFDAAQVSQLPPAQTDHVLPPLPPQDTTINYDLGADELQLPPRQPTINPIVGSEKSKGKKRGRKDDGQASQRKKAKSKKKKQHVEWYQPALATDNFEYLDKFVKDIQNHIYRMNGGKRAERLFVNDDQTLDNQEPDGEIPDEDIPNQQELEVIMEEFQQRLSEVKFKDGLNQAIIDASNLLEPGQGISAIADSTEAMFPSHLREYAQELRHRLQRGIFTPNLWHGLRWNGHWSNAEGMKKVKPGYYGQGNLVNGQWWPSRLTACRDGAHGNTQKGIHGKKGQAAFSIVMSGDNPYTGDDSDAGDTITYCGERSTPKDGKTVIPHSNQQLIQAHESETPVRVFRSANLPDTNIYRPECGIRYDGLYIVTQVHPQQEGSTISHIFDLRRIAGQEPIRRRGTTGERPTQAEVQAFGTSRARQTAAAQHASFVVTAVDEDDDEDESEAEAEDGDETKIEVQAEVLVEAETQTEAQVEAQTEVQAETQTEAEVDCDGDAKMNDAQPAAEQE